jgi:hypothetical protein
VKKNLEAEEVGKARTIRLGIAVIARVIRVEGQVRVVNLRDAEALELKVVGRIARQIVEIIILQARAVLQALTSQQLV